MEEIPEEESTSNKLKSTLSLWNLLPTHIASLVRNTRVDLVHERSAPR